MVQQLCVLVFRKRSRHTRDLFHVLSHSWPYFFRCFLSHPTIQMTESFENIPFILTFIPSIPKSHVRYICGLWRENTILASREKIDGNVAEVPKVSWCYQVGCR